MPDAASRLRQLIGSHTAGGHWDDGAPMSVAQVLGEATVGELADAVHDDQIAPLQAEIDRLEVVRDQARRLHGEAVAERNDKRRRLIDAEAERDTARAALVEIRDRHQRHGDLCDACDAPTPCWYRRTAERGLGESEET